MKPETVTVAMPRVTGTREFAGHGWLGIPAAVAAFVTNCRFFTTRQPGTPLRVLSLIAIDAALRSRGGALSPDQRQAVVEAMELGALLNDRFDGDVHDPAALRASVAWFKRSAHREVVWNYAKRLRLLERSRPDAGGSSVAVRIYRENVNHVSLATLWALANGMSLAIAELEFRREHDLRLLFQIVMQTQLIDDVLDVRQDRRRCLPSFGADSMVSPRSLRGLVSIYGDTTPIRADRTFCLRVALGLVAASARGVIAIRTAHLKGS